MIPEGNPPSTPRAFGIKLLRVILSFYDMLIGCFLFSGLVVLLFYPSTPRAFGFECSC